MAKRRAMPKEPWNRGATNPSKPRKSKELADLSTDANFSDHSVKTDSSADGRNRRRLPSDSSDWGPMSDAPPGLDMPTQGGQSRAQHPWKAKPALKPRTAMGAATLLRQCVQNEKRAVRDTGWAEQRWNPQAAPFTPQFAAAGDNMENDPPGLGDESNLSALKNAIDKLAPTEIASIKSILESKLGTDQGNQFSTERAPRSFQPFRESGADLAEARSFRPFQGHRNVPQDGMRQMRPARDAQNHRHNKSTEVEEHSGESMRTFLRDLALLEHDARVVSVRRISGLGLNSPEILQNYFAKFGTVERIMVSHTHQKSKIPGGRFRLRPAALGFAVMSTEEEAQAALNHGSSHIVAGVDIHCGPFQSHSVINME